MKLFITGIEGFSGIHFSNYFKKFGYDVYGSSLTFNNKKIFKCDVTKKDELFNVINTLKPDYIIHLAAVSFANEDDFLNYYKVNTIGTQNLLNSINYNIKKVIIASSATVYGNQNSEVLDESMSVNPNNHYGLSKFAAEQIAKNFFDKMPVVITRAFNYTGIGQNEKFLIPKIVAHYKNKAKTIKLGNLDVIREFNDVSFVCECYKRLLEKNVKNEIVNIASGRGIRLLDVVQYMNEIAGYEIEVQVDKRFIRKNDIKKLIGSNKKLFSLIGEVKQKDFKQTLKEMYEYSG